ncbi:GNAT family N-acetyltransferase [Metabacillus litoralis]|uniref:GNAT family N-acetyltransferase n=1 Tax=Metabacillus litoralis TaxID=152268 RepID=UPI00203CCCEA|nr:GNAT family N-acetyltransferase [Metabacillus litoralis]MCM3164890.1 GNAT family N-acetyltransferase [Metabacillus litoralis]
MKIKQQEFEQNQLKYMIRSAEENDAFVLSELRVRIDGETENLDREPGEAYIDEAGFNQLIKEDTEKQCNLFLVVEVNNKIVGFSRCEGSELKRLAHKVEFGICVLKEFWGYGIGRNLLGESLKWADSTGIKKVTLSVLETNVTAIELYKKFGFEVEGILKNDKLLSDGQYYHTMIMGRLYEKIK